MGYAARTSGERPREITQRRFKEAAATAIDQHAGVIGQLAEAINQTNESARVSREFAADLSVRLDVMQERVRVLELPRTFELTLLGRLRWLLTGK